MHLSYTFQFQPKWVKLHQNTVNILVITIYGISDRSHDQTNKIFELSLKNGSEWYITSWLNNNFLAITIYGNRNKSHDHKNNIFELSLKNGSEWYITSLVDDNSLVITIYGIETSHMTIGITLLTSAWKMGQNDI